MKQVDAEMLAALSAVARSSVRRRANLNVHPTLDDPVQRFLNAVEPDSYVRPHRHTTLPPRWELFVLLAGAAVVLTFDDEGVVLERVQLSAEGPVRALEIPAGAWHVVAALVSGTVLFEFKPGPYTVAGDKDFAVWAPPEGAPEASVMLARYRVAMPGDNLAAAI